MCLSVIKRENPVAPLATQLMLHKPFPWFQGTQNFIKISEQVTAT